MAFGIRKALQTEQGKSEMESRITQLEADVKDLERQVGKGGEPVGQGMVPWIRNPHTEGRCPWRFLLAVPLRRTQIPAHPQVLLHKVDSRSGQSGPAYCAMRRPLYGPRRCVLQVQEWKFKCEAIEKRESERREADAKKHKEEVAYLENYAKQLKQQLETFLVPAKKPAPGAPAPA